MQKRKTHCVAGVKEAEKYRAATALVESLRERGFLKNERNGDPEHSSLSNQAKAAITALAEIKHLTQDPRFHSLKAELEKAQGAGKASSVA